MSIQFKRGLSSAREDSDKILDNGQPFYETNTKKLYIGDGSTQLKNLSTIVANDVNAAHLSDDNNFTSKNTFNVQDIDVSNPSTSTMVWNTGFSIVPTNRSPGKECITFGWTDTSHNSPAIFTRASWMPVNVYKFPDISKASSLSGTHTILTDDGIGGTLTLDAEKSDSKTRSITFAGFNDDYTTYASFILNTPGGRPKSDTIPTYTLTLPELSGTLATITDVNKCAKLASSNSFSNTNTFSGTVTVNVPNTMGTTTSAEGLTLLPATRSPGREFIKIGYNSLGPCIAVRGSTQMKNISYIFSTTKDEGTYTLATTDDISNSTYVIQRVLSGTATIGTYYSISLTDEDKTQIESNYDKVIFKIFHSISGSTASTILRPVANLGSGQYRYTSGPFTAYDRSTQYMRCAFVQTNYGPDMKVNGASFYILNISKLS